MIRIIQHTDAERLWSLVELNRDYLKRWLPWLDRNTSIEDTRKFITDSLEAYAAKKSMIYVIDDGTITGVCGFNSFNHSIKSGYIGYWISKECQGKGLVTQACRELERIGFELVQLNKIEIHVAEGNSKSRKVPERLGYLETGCILDAEWLYDRYVDHVIYCKKNPANKALHQTPTSGAGEL